MTNPLIDEKLNLNSQPKKTGLQTTKGLLREGNLKPKKRVTFAPGPELIAVKYKTQDGHPDHEGIVAEKPTGAAFRGGLPHGPSPDPLTVNNLQLLEKELGEECRPSLDRLKRRLGLLPLRQRPKEYLTWLKPSNAHESDDEDLSPSKKRQPALPNDQNGTKRIKVLGLIGLTATTNFHAKQTQQGAFKGLKGLKFPLSMASVSSDTGQQQPHRSHPSRLGGLNDPVLGRRSGKSTNL